MSLNIQHLSVNLGEKTILQDINLEIQPGTIHALMGPNGSGKSTLAAALMGNPSYDLGFRNYELRIDKENLIPMSSDQRARMGLFLAFQNPIAIPGITVANLLKTAYQVKQGDGNSTKKPLKKVTPDVWKFNQLLVGKAKELGIPQEFLRRSLNEEFSGGEKKKMEMLQAIVLSPKYAIFDEIDTGLDVDALKTVAYGIEALKKERTGVLLITHYQRILKYARPDFVHILINGKIVESGTFTLAEEVEKEGYKRWTGMRNHES